MNCTLHTSTAQFRDLSIARGFVLMNWHRDRGDLLPQCLKAGGNQGLPMQSASKYKNPLRFMLSGCRCYSDSKSGTVLDIPDGEERRGWGRESKREREGGTDRDVKISRESSERKNFSPFSFEGSQTRPQPSGRGIFRRGFTL
jgi:hypothetical protein